MVHKLGIWDAGLRSTIPGEADWVVATNPSYGEANLLKNPSFEVDFLDWELYTPPDNTPMLLDILPGVVGNSAVMVSNDLGNRGGLRQSFRDVPPNTTFHFRAMVKTVEIEALEVRVLHRGIFVGGVWREQGTWGIIRGSHDWTLYEVSFTTPNEISRVDVYPALVYNRGEVWIDEASLTVDGWQIPPTKPTILNWFWLHSPWVPSFNPFKTEADINLVEQGLKTVPIENFSGIIGPVCEEHYRAHIGFNDDVNTTYFGESMLGYPLYLTESPGATVDQWKDEMYLRMIRGFYNYFHPLTKVGITTSGSSIVPNWKNQSWSGGIPQYFGEPAMNFIRKHYDFVVLYAYTTNLQYFNDWTSQYFQLIDQLFQKQNKLWILTRIWGYNEEDWEAEAMALEMKNCFDRNITLTCYYSNNPPLEEIWPLMLRGRELYDAKAPYTQSVVYDENLLLGNIGNTYGWVANPEHDEGLYPMPIRNLLLFPLIIGGALWLKGKVSKKRG